MKSVIDLPDQHCLYSMLLKIGLLVVVVVVERHQFAQYDDPQRIEMRLPVVPTA